MLRLIACAALASVATVSAASAADLYIPSEPMPIIESMGFDWEGLYAGAELGGYFEEDSGSQVFVSGTVGYNFLVADPILLGLELEGTYYFENEDDGLLEAGELMVNGRVGFLATESVLLYALGGVGAVWFEDSDNDFTQYALGVGIEAAVTESISLRGEVKGLGDFEDDDMFYGTNASVGVFFHF